MSKKDRFAQKVMAEIRRLDPSLEPRYDAAGFRIEVRPSQTVNLHNALDEYERAGFFRRGGVISQLARSAVVVGDIPASYADARASILPRVRERLWYEVVGLQMEAEGRTMDLPVHRPLSDTLAVELVYDTPENMALIGQAQLDGWRRSFEDVRDQGLVTLRERSTGRFDMPRPGFFVSPWKDAHDAARILLHDLIRRLAVKGDPVAAVPNRDHLLVTGSEDVDGLRRLAEWIERLHKAPRFMSGTPIVLGDDGWRTFAPPADHPAHALVVNARLVDEARAYAEQAAALEALFEKKGRDVYVGAVEVPQRPRDATYRSWTTWSRGVVTLVPKTSDIVFVDDRGEDKVSVVRCPWEPAFAALSHRMVLERTYPPRWLVESFPSDDELRELARCEGSERAEVPRARGAGSRS